MNFLDYVEKASDKGEIIERWKDAIISKYSQKEDYLYGQMADMYVSLYPARMGYSVPKGMDRAKMRYIISNWIMNYYVEPIEKAKMVLEKDYYTKTRMMKTKYELYSCKWTA